MISYYVRILRMYDVFKKILYLVIVNNKRYHFFVYYLVNFIHVFFFFLITEEPKIQIEEEVYYSESSKRVRGNSVVKPGILFSNNLVTECLICIYS